MPSQSLTIYTYAINLIAFVVGCLYAIVSWKHSGSPGRLWAIGTALAALVTLPAQTPLGAQIAFALHALLLLYEGSELDESWAKITVICLRAPSLAWCAQKL